jgi:uncharacterized SAM-binding protein YcdF (DUF218 family)
MMNALYEFTVAITEPHTILLLLIVFAMYRLWRRRRDPTRRVLPLVLLLLALAVISTPAVAHLALLSLEGQYAPAAERPGDAGAVVVFAAGVLPPEGPRVRAEMDEDTLKRCLLAAQLYGQGPPCPIMVCGGQPDRDQPGPTAASVMAEFLVRLGVKESDIVPEERSQTTYQNAVECAALLKERGIGRVVLVVDAVDMPRAAACLRKQGIEVAPSPSHFRATNCRWSIFTFIPNPGAAGAIRRVWHEWVGLQWYRLRGRV